MNASTMKERLDAAPVIAADSGDPRPLPEGLLAVAEFDLAMLPEAFRPWITDIAERMQVPPEFAAVPAMIAAGSVIGNRIAIRPMRRDNWQEVPNLWGCIIGRPGVLKSPSVKAGLKPLGRMVGDANAQYQEALKEWKAGEVERELRQQARKAGMRKALKDDPAADVSHLHDDEERVPICRRYVTNDGSYQAIGELLVQNPDGLLVHRDELLSLLTALDREENSEARGFYLTAWNGADSYTFDRIGRGLNLHIPKVTASLLGASQPTKIAAYVRRVMDGGASDDGMLQRFSMTVWPDMPAQWEEHDRFPVSEYAKGAYDAFVRLDRLTASDAGAERDSLDDDDPFLRFGDDAQELFRDWRRGFEVRLRSGELHPAFESHLSKYRKLVPSLALIHHLASGNTGPVGSAAILAALAWAQFLESHAMRIYHSGASGDVDGAKAILRALRSGRLESPFTSREIVRRNWSPMGTEVARVQSAIELLAEHSWIFRNEVPAGPNGGRPSVVYHVNPKAFVR